MLEIIVHPDSHFKLKEITSDFYIFEDSSKLPIHNGTPVLFGAESIFNQDDIVNSKVTTQDRSHLDTSNIKNYVRRRLLPSLCKDFNLDKRYEVFRKLIPAGGRILILGAGEKINYYKSIFPDCQVITSDVHNQFNPDFIFDGHFIPFTDNSFDAVLAAQVIEHTINPWKFCAELQRIVKVGGVLQIEAPQSFPYHAEPYDFFRFTFTGMRSLFPECAVVKAEITEGNAANLAVTMSNYFVNLSSKKLIRSSWLFLTRIMFGWLKYLDKLEGLPNRRNVSMPKGYAFTFRKDNTKRNSKDMLQEFYNLKK
ncbi:class I SAM-dependent methyltransferase [Flavobacterium panacagri]|uniref:class I SAM-dependent methyltransferase n=1 Tax=Flavobacterium panacagri TaxID=3034146 RepID=UPI0025A51F83|nr:class I SAM-dependent methyltransferase [Flavobacterium panacagri]